MYEEFFGLRERPFDLTPNPRFLVLTESHSEVLSNLEYGIGSRKGITVLVGEAGSGKTTLIRTAIQRQPARVHAVHLSNPTLSRQEFTEMLAAQFGLSDAAARSKAAMLVELEALLRHRRDADESTVLIVDEAHSLPMELLEEIRLLANIETDDDKLLGVILAGQPELADRLNTRDLRQFKQRIALRCELRPLTLQEAAGYIDGRVRTAGGVGSGVFTRDAVALMHEYSHGIPRTISVIADNALLGGFAASVRPVGADIVRDVCRDFDLLAGSPIAASPPVAASAMPPVPAPVTPVARVPLGASPFARLMSEADRPVPPPVPESVLKPVPALPDASSGREDRGGMFASFSAKRKRFSFFGA